MFLPRRAELLGADGANVMEVGQCLFRLLTLIRQHEVVFPMASVQYFHERTKRYLHLMNELGLADKPKEHFLQHLAGRILEQGSPTWYSNWIDESINRLLRDVAAWGPRSCARCANPQGVPEGL